MAKRGETRPFKLYYEWANGVSGKLAFRTPDDRHYAYEEMQRVSEQRELSVSIEYRTEVPAQSLEERMRAAAQMYNHTA